jgi:hypothetical protein
MRRFNHFLVGSAIAAMLMAGAGANAALPAGFNVTIEAPGVQQNTSSTFDAYGIETFNNLTPGNYASYSTDFGGSPITGTYSSLKVLPADQYGGAGGGGDYAVAGLGFGNNSYSLKLSSDTPVNYFGFWLSALDAGNVLEFYDQGTLLGSFTPTDVIALVGNSGPYFGNPNNGQNGGQPYVFVNFFKQTGGFDEIVFRQTDPGAGYESDNHTVGWWTSQGGNPVPGIPEPATWAMLIAGFGMIGAASRRRGRSNIRFA